MHLASLMSLGLLYFLFSKTDSQKSRCFQEVELKKDMCSVGTERDSQVFHRVLMCFFLASDSQDFGSLYSNRSRSYVRGRVYKPLRFHAPYSPIFTANALRIFKNVPCPQTMSSVALAMSVIISKMSLQILHGSLPCFELKSR
jgi:hypothetical protein